MTDIPRPKTKFEIDADKEADLFAFALLMPEDFIKAELRKFADGKTSAALDLCDDNDELLTFLAKKFDVSKGMMVLRLQQLGMIT